MNKFEITKNTSLARSLNLLNQLLIKSLDFSTSFTIIVNERQAFIYPEHQEEELNHFKEDTLQEILDRKDVSTWSTPILKDPTLEVNYFSTPLVSFTGNRIGALILAHNKTQTFTTDEISTLSHFAQITANIIEKDLESQTIQQTFSDFLHRTIHDLKNPLTSIALTAELLKKKSEDPKMVIGFSDKLDRASKRLFSNMEDIKTIFPLVDQSSFKLSIAEINLSALLSDIKISCPAIYINIKKDNPVVIYGDYPRLKQAITQLITANHCPTVDIDLYTTENNVEINISGAEINDFNHTAFLIGKLLIEMHRGKVENRESSYIISFPLEKP
ncbi:sensor histidine kinase [Pedobacter helvus]|mgnify:CR=1 FL=1|uniref:histidine kinase n=1 Tax=Pedobacter helvus TaxID=2563444 RepID=A0ABW9JKG5_9SPHI|nr:HAMP domain-containing histidine kinase [Pedobacter ureilyticus]